MSSIIGAGAAHISRTDESVTSNDVPDPSDLPRVFGFYILVRPVKTHTEKTKGGILLPEQTQDDVKYLCNVGRVLSIGPMAFKKEDGTDSGWTGDTPLKIGDFVQFERHSGKRFKYKGVNLVLLRDTAISFGLEDPALVDPMTALGDNV